MQQHRTLTKLPAMHAYLPSATVAEDMNVPASRHRVISLVWPPQVNNVGMLQSYYYAAYAAVRKYAPNCFVAVSPREWEQDGAEWQFFMAAPPYTKVIQDLHRHVVTARRCAEGTFVAFYKCCTNASRTDATTIVHGWPGRYQVSFAGPQFAPMTPQQHVDYAHTVEKQLYKGYIAKGGLPPVFGEWALAGVVLHT